VLRRYEIPIASGKPRPHHQGVLAALPSLTKAELIIGALVAALVLLNASVRAGARRRRARVRWFGLGALAAGSAGLAFLGLPGRGSTVAQTMHGSTVTPVAAKPRPSLLSGATLNDAGFARLRAGDYKGALPLLEQAVKRLNGSGSIVDAYALYNLAATRFDLGDCTGVLSMLDRSQKRQGRRREIDTLRAAARRRCLKR
jgi:hypothetical protein